ncbi:ABC transporter ATP-binding protein [Rhizobium leguminosarum]|uniref:ABC transporter ATP-binding protein n=1 Tax=Rhizobium leguminosarum TaxID=384 RepID=UPI001F230ADF|nr:ABC transporter ATP-binding protein [Rhizobium leguminosarum]UIJ81760.1 ABC transporter ATP-binding protein [Rhizobium leguminosarum]
MKAVAADSAIQLSGVGKVYRTGRGEVPALEDVSFRVPKGTCTALIGPSGCGKSSLLEIIGGLEPPTSGRIEFSDESIGRPPFTAMVFQHYGLLPWKTVEQNLDFPLRIAGMPAEQRRRLIDQQLKGFGLTAFGRRHPHHLSGGMKQRVALARALVMNPQILLLDEPFGALDAYNRWSARTFFFSVQQEWSRTTVLVTHDVDEALDLAHQIVVFTPHPGRVAALIANDPVTSDVLERNDKRRLLVELLFSGMEGNGDNSSPASRGFRHA